MLTIYKKEIHGYFTTFLGYLFILAIVLAGGFYCYIYNFVYKSAVFSDAMKYVPFFFVFLIPVIASGVFTEEKRQKTDQLLYTLPIRSRDIVLGKFFALITVLAIPFLILGVYPILMSFYGNVRFNEAYASLFIVFLLGITLSAICMFISSITPNLVVSSVICFGVVFAMYLMNTILENMAGSEKNSIIGLTGMILLLCFIIWAATRNIYIAAIPTFAAFIVMILMHRRSINLLSGTVNRILKGLALFDGVSGFMSGILDLGAVIYYLSITALFVVFTIYIFERRRWN